MKENNLSRIMLAIAGLAFVNISHSAMPKYTIVPIVPGSNNIEMAINSTKVIQYTVTNNFPKPRTLGLDTFPGITQITTGIPQECSIPFTLAAGGSCVMQVQLDGSRLPSKVSGGPAVCTMSQGKPGPQCSQPSFENALHITVSSSSLLNLAIAGSIILTNNIQSILQFKVPFSIGLTQNPVPVPGSANLERATYLGYSCTPIGNGRALCIATGSSSTTLLHGSKALATSTPKLYKSENGGANWSEINVANTPTDGAYNVASTVTVGSVAKCVAAGYDAQAKPYLTQSLDSGTTWNMIDPNLLPTTGKINDISCNTSGFCIAVGSDQSFSASTPLLMVYNGTSWSRVMLGSIPGTLTSGSCTINGSSPRCVAVGESGGSPLLVDTTDGVNWSQVPTSVSNGIFNGVSCIPGFCVAAGTETGSGNIPLVFETLGTVNWVRVSNNSIPNLPANGKLNAASCSTATCIVAGRAETSNNGSPLLIQSNNQGSSWSTVAIPDITTNGEFLTASCVSNPLCVAQGQDYNTGLPLLAESLDGTITSWSVSNTLSTLFKNG